MLVKLKLPPLAAAASVRSVAWMVYWAPGCVEMILSGAPAKGHSVTPARLVMSKPPHGGLPSLMSSYPIEVGTSRIKCPTARVANASRKYMVPQGVVLSWGRVERDEDVRDGISRFTRSAGVVLWLRTQIRLAGDTLKTWLRWKSGIQVMPLLIVCNGSLVQTRTTLSLACSVTQANI